MSPMKKTLLTATAGLSLSMMLSVTPITIAHAEPIEMAADDALILNGNDCKLFILGTGPDDGTVAGTFCLFTVGNLDTTMLKRGRVELVDADGRSDILWTHNDHFHYISDPFNPISDAPLGPGYVGPAGHLGEFNNLLKDDMGIDGLIMETSGPIDVSVFFGFPKNTIVITSDGPAPAPEPATLSLLLVGLAGLGYRLRQRKL